jgi:hypothetical protein
MVTQNHVPYFALHDIFLLFSLPTAPHSSTSRPFQNWVQCVHAESWHIRDVYDERLSQETMKYADVPSLSLSSWHSPVKATCHRALPLQAGSEYSVKSALYVMNVREEPLLVDEDGTMADVGEGEGVGVRDGVGDGVGDGGGGRAHELHSQLEQKDTAPAAGPYAEPLKQ